MNETALFSSFAKGAQTSIVKGSIAVLYTRVSTKEQAETNLSLETQFKACQQYAKKMGYSILANFGGTYESAQTDERKEFLKMLAFVKKSKQKVSFIICYSLERFSRNSNSIWLSGQLRKLGIEIISVTQPIDTSNPSGQMQQKMLFLFGEFDNELRKQKCMAGAKEMLLNGDWCTRPPYGYDSVRLNGKRRIIINQKGKLLRQAFEWKAHLGLSNEAIRAKLAEKGLKFNHQRISEMMRNPFYCGLMVHNMLDGQVVPGNHEALISKELFLQVNGLLNHNAHGYKIREENDALPLKRFIHCDECNKPMRGYIVKKKNINYYKCNTIGCGNNKNATSLNQKFLRILEVFKLDAASELIGLIKKQTVATFNQHTKGQQDQYALLQEQHTSITSKIARLEERFIEEEIKIDLYNRYLEKYNQEKKEIEANLLKATKQVSNLEECVEMAVGFAAKLPFKWLSADYSPNNKFNF